MPVDASDPVSSSMSVPAAAARMASEVAETPREAAVPSRESVMVTPVKPSVPRSRSVPTACDHPAALDRSYAV